MEKDIQKGMYDGIQTDTDIKKMDVNTLFSQYIDVRKLADTTKYGLAGR